MQITLARDPDDLAGVRDLTRAYLEGEVADVARTAGVPLDIDAYLAQTFDNIDT